jgi:hypothetical protein
LLRLQGYGEVWSANSTVLKCVELPSSDKRTTIIVAVISAVAGLALLSAVLLVAQLYMRTRPKWLREHIMETKRKQGAPRCRTRGDKVHVSIVVTDVKDYTALTREQPEAMNRAIGVHNNILRKVSTCMGGYPCDNCSKCSAQPLHVQSYDLTHPCWPVRDVARTCVCVSLLVCCICHIAEPYPVYCSLAFVVKTGLLLLLLFVLQACHTHAGYVLDQVRRLQQRKSLLSHS